MTTFNILSNVLNQNRFLNEQIENQNRALDSLDYVNRQMKFNDTPIQAKTGKWEEFDTGEYNSLIRQYNFQTSDHVIYFINEVLKESNRIDHHPIIKISHNEIDITLYTRDINDITESDIKLSRIIDEIFEDISYIGMK